MSEKEGQEIRKGSSFMIDLNAEGGDPFSSVQTVTPEADDQNQHIDDDDQNKGVDDDHQIDDDVDDSGADDIGDDADDDVGDDDDDADDADDSDVNPYYYLGEQLKSDNFLREDFEITEDISGSTVYSAYRDKLREELEPQIRQAVYSELEKQGVNERDLLFAKAIRQGIDLRMLDTASMHERYASMSIESPSDDKRDSIQQMYRSRGFSETEAESLIREAEKDDKVDILFDEATAYHTGRYNSFVEERQQQAKTIEEQERQLEEYVEGLIRGVISNRSLYGEELTPEQAKGIEDAIYNSSVKVDINGVDYVGTEFQAFLVELVRNPELKLYLFKKFKYKDEEKDIIKKKAKKEAEDELLKGYEKAVVKDRKASKNKRIRQKLESQKNTARSFLIDLSEQKQN